MVQLRCKAHFSGQLNFMKLLNLVNRNFTFLFSIPLIEEFLLLVRSNTRETPSGLETNTLTREQLAQLISQFHRGNSPSRT